MELLDLGSTILPFYLIFMRYMLSKKTFTVEEAKKKLEHYCAYQERCHQEVEKKLVEMGMIPEAREVIIIHLIENGFLNEERFAKAFARGKFTIKKWGKRRITLALKGKAISDYNIKAALKTIDHAEYEKTFHELAGKRCAAIKENNTHKKRKKLADYLLYRGWESDLVYKKIRELIP